MPEPGRLRGLDILVPESRELDLFCRMLSAEGAVPHRCPLVAILNLADESLVEAWLDRLLAGSFDDLILLTGEGLRRLVGVARRGGRETATVQAIGRVRTVTRGPKPVRALREIGFAPGLQAAIPTTDGVIALLHAEAMQGRRVGVQLYPQQPNLKLIAALETMGAIADPVTPYRYASDTENGQVVQAIEGLAAGAFDLIAFTSSPQLARLVAVAGAHGLVKSLARGLARTRVAAVGPVVAAALRDAGYRVDIEPPSVFHLKPLIAAIGASMAPLG